MNCFGEIQKIPAAFDNSFRRYHRRFVQTDSKNEILVTESPNLVIKYDISDGKFSSLQTWTFKEFKKLSVPMIMLNDGTGNLLGVHTGNTVIEWKQNDNESEMIFSRKLKNEIINIFPLMYHPDPLLIFSNGWAEFYSTIKNDNWIEEIDSVIEKNEKIIGMDTNLKSKKIRQFVYLLVTDSKNNIFVYKCVFLKKSNAIIRQVLSHTEKSRLSRIPDAWTFLHNESKMIGASIHDDKTINVYSLEPPINEETNFFLFYLVESSSKKLHSLSSCDGGAIGVLGNKSDNEFLLEIYDDSYHVKISMLILESNILPWSFCAIGDNFFIGCTNSLIMIPIVNQQFSLSQFLTKTLHEDAITEDDSVKSTNFVKFKHLLGFTENENNNLPVEKVVKINNKLKNCLNAGEQIPEKIIVFMLDVVTKNIMNCDDKNTELREKLKILFQDLVELPFNQIFLVSCLKSFNISVEQCLLSIELLLDLLPSGNTILLSWICILLDANYNKFIIKPDLKIVESLEKISERVSNNIQFFEKLGTTQTYRDAITKKAKFFLSAITDDTPPVGQYSIELMTLT